jgi:hypothetical protein
MVNNSPGESTDGLHATDQKRLYDDVARQLEIAEDYLKRRASIISWWRGTRLEGAWGHIHNARVGLIELMDDAHLDAYSPQVLALANKYLREDDPERVAVSSWYDRLLSITLPPRTQQSKASNRKNDSRDGGPASQGSTGQLGKVSKSERLALAAALRAVYERIANEYHRLRRFQTTIAVSSLLMLILVVGLVTLGAIRPGAVPLCFPDPTATVLDAAADTSVCPSGGEVPARGDVAIVVGFGLIGAALTGVRIVVRRSAPSSVPIATTRAFQALLKAVIGVLAAFLGLLFLRAGIVPGFTHVDTQSQILVYAVVFGASQELITRFIDDRSNTLLSKVTSAEPGQEAPTGDFESDS